MSSTRPEPRLHLRVRHPRPKALEVSEVAGEGWGLLTEKVPGVTLADKMAAEPAKFYEYLEQFVDLQVEIHAERSPLLNRQRDKYARMINGLQHINATTRYNLMERLDGMKKEFQICHGDFNPEQRHRGRGRPALRLRLGPRDSGLPCRRRSHDLPAVRP